ncbi:hypothetical protein M758_11G083000 [Ceratodon purpureus]|nr:hypothetical protein M758_11G083000 [Ceratodon purpureus]
MRGPSSLNKQGQESLVFALNGERVEVPNVDPATTLLSYIRSETRFKGPKRSCGEGTSSFSCSLVLSLSLRVTGVGSAWEQLPKVYCMSEKIRECMNMHSVLADIQ